MKKIRRALSAKYSKVAPFAVAAAGLVASSAHAAATEFTGTVDTTKLEGAGTTAALIMGIGVAAWGLSKVIGLVRRYGKF